MRRSLPPLPAQVLPARLPVLPSGSRCTRRSPSWGLQRSFRLSAPRSLSDLVSKGSCGSPSRWARSCAWCHPTFAPQPTPTYSALSSATLATSARPYAVLRCGNVRSPSDKPSFAHRSPSRRSSSSRLRRCDPGPVTPRGMCRLTGRCSRRTPAVPSSPSVPRRGRSLYLRHCARSAAPRALLG